MLDPPEKKKKTEKNEPEWQFQGGGGKIEKQKPICFCSLFFVN